MTKPKKRLCHILQAGLIDSFDVAMTVLAIHLKSGVYWWLGGIPNGNDNL